MVLYFVSPCKLSPVPRKGTVKDFSGSSLLPSPVQKVFAQSVVPFLKVCFLFFKMSLASLGTEMFALTEDSRY